MRADNWALTPQNAPNEPKVLPEFTPVQGFLWVCTYSYKHTLLNGAFIFNRFVVKQVYFTGTMKTTYVPDNNGERHVLSNDPNKGKNFNRVSETVASFTSKR